MRIAYYQNFKDAKPGEEPWEEQRSSGEIKDHESAQIFAKAIVQNWNNALKPGERARVLTNVIVMYADKPDFHCWTKKSLVTEKGGYDKMVCSVCGATGKRHGLGQNGVVPDKKGKCNKVC